jgi:hypothetical protein
MRRWLSTAVTALSILLPACGGAGRYGYAQTYVALGDEESWVARANNEAVYDEVRRMPESYRAQTLSFFGVVTGVEGAHGSTPARVSIQIRTHQARHLCDDETDRSCRVTVSARDGGPLTAVVSLRPDDAAGENRVQVFSLLRVFGSLVPGEYDAAGGPVIRADFYRHWPRGEYVTTDAASAMRR